MVPQSVFHFFKMFIITKSLIIYTALPLKIDMLRSYHSTTESGNSEIKRKKSRVQYPFTNTKLKIISGSNKLNTQHFAQTIYPRVPSVSHINYHLVLSNIASPVFRTLHLCFSGPSLILFSSATTGSMWGEQIKIRPLDIFPPPRSSFAFQSMV